MTMRILSMITAAAALTLASGAALAQSVALTSITIGEALEAKRDDYGPRALDRLEAELRDSIEHALERANLLADADAADIFIAVTLEDAFPNRPTFAQLSNQPGLSYESYSRGGARLSATLSGADGTQLGEADYHWRTMDITDAAHRSTWTDADRTFDRFARRLADQAAEAVPAG